GQRQAGLSATSLPLHITGGYCWRMYFKVRAGLFLASVSPAFLPSTKACGTHQFRHWGVRQQYPGVIWRLCGMGNLACCTRDTVKHAGQRQAARRPPASGCGDGSPHGRAATPTDLYLLLPFFPSSRRSWSSLWSGSWLSLSGFLHWMESVPSISSPSTVFPVSEAVLSSH